jgi:hypothetical protein
VTPLADGAPFPPVFPLASLFPAAGGDGSAGFVLSGIDANDFSGDFSGRSVSAAGDVNGDGISDVIVGAFHGDRGGDHYAGESYIVFGSTTGFPAVVRLASLYPAGGGDGTRGFVLTGIDVEDYSGISVSEAGDVNGDGIDDLIVGAVGADPGGDEDAGESYIVFGRKDTDGDNIADALDNCTLVANADQRDTNGDGYGNVCDPDLNNDGIVNFSDLGLLKPLFFSADPDADFNGDGAVNFVDLGTMKTFFFLPPGPSGLAQLTNAGLGGLPDVSAGMPVVSQ